MSIGSIIMSVLPLKKDEIGSFSLYGYILQPLLNFENNVPLEYASAFFTEYGAGVKIPQIVNRNLRGHAGVYDIPYNDFEYFDNDDAFGI